MTLPEEFNEWEHLQYTLRKVHNDQVRDFYQDQPDLDISTTKSAAKHACLMKDDDTSTMTVLRFWLFWVVCRKMRDNFEPYRDSYEPELATGIKYKPKVTLFFIEDPQDIEPEYQAVQGKVTFRLMSETTSTLTKAKLETLANKIRLEFGQNNGHVWRKGKELYTYGDKAEGQFFQVLARTQADAVEIINKALDCVNVPYKSKLLRKSEAIDSASAFPTIPNNQTVLGEITKEPRVRPIADVRFTYASIKLDSVAKPIILLDKTMYWNNALVQA